MHRLKSRARRTIVQEIIVLIGAPGAGKGTQGQLLSEAFSLPLVSTGSILREIAKDNTPFGHQIRNVMSAGELASDEILASIIRQRTSEEDCRHGYILDGHPRSCSHAEWLDNWSKEQRKKLVAIFLDVPYEEIHRRLSGRRICRNCNKVFNTHLKSFEDQRSCDLCGGKLTSRPDDTPLVIDRRLKVFEKATAPLVQFYKQKNQLVVIDGRGSAEDVFRRLFKGLSRRAS